MKKCCLNCKHEYLSTGIEPCVSCIGISALPYFDAKIIIDLPSARTEISRIEQELHGKTPEEQYEFLYWLLLKFGLTYTDSRLAVIEWLRGGKKDGRHDQQTGGD